ncbi:MAG: hypothetical protein WDN28_29790 [Chthoniobacter sp.]
MLLRDAGYQIGKSYKVWGPGKPADAPIGGQQYAYEKSGRLPNRFSSNVTKMVTEGMAVDAAREKILDQVRGNFKSFLADQKQGSAVAVFLRPDEHASAVGERLGQAALGNRSRVGERQDAEVSAGCSEIREDVADNLGEAQAVDAYVGCAGENGRRGRRTGSHVDRPSAAITEWAACRGRSAICMISGSTWRWWRAWPGGKGGRIVDDFVRLPDLAPTFMEVGGVTPPADLYGRSLKAQLQSDQSGQIDPERNWVLSGRERHVATAREDNLPYPMRCLRTPEFLYIRNFAPDRWPMGAPYSAGASGAPPAEELETNTYAAYPDMDASPTKAWLIIHRDDPQWKWHFDHAFGKRPAEELYDLRKDPDQTVNVAADAAYAAQKDRLAAELMKKLKEAADPRVTGDGLTFDHLPMPRIDFIMHLHRFLMRAVIVACLAASKPEVVAKYQSCAGNDGRPIAHPKPEL